MKVQKIATGEKLGNTFFILIYGTVLRDSWVLIVFLQTFAGPRYPLPLVCTSLHPGDPPSPLRANVIYEWPLSILKSLTSLKIAVRDEAEIWVDTSA